MPPEPPGHEAAFAKAFILSEKRARFVQYLANPKRRKEMLEQITLRLPHMPALALEVPGPQDYPEELEKLLKARGAGPTCHVMADGLKEDGRVLPLAQALKVVCLSERGAILSCIAGRLAYYKPGSPGAGLILEAKGQPCPRG